MATYEQFGGVHAETASLTNVLAALGVRNPLTDAPFSEALLFGIGGGLGIGYILWEFQAHNTKVLVLAFQNNWQYTTRFYDKLCGRINVGVAYRETSGRAAAQKHLDAALDAGTPVVAWVDRAHLPYLHLPDVLKGHFGHLVAVCGGEDGAVLVDDLADAPFVVDAEVFADARGRISSYKSRLLIAEPGEPADVPAAVAAGIRDCVEHLSEKSDSFSLPTIRKWARMMTDARQAKGWPKAFADRKGLYGTLKSAFEGVALQNPGGLRALYADFLDDASGILGKPALSEIAGQYRALAAAWNDFAEATLPDDVAPLAETKRLLREKYALLAQGQPGVDAAAPISARINTLHAPLDRDFPMGNTEVSALFEAMGARLQALYEAEVAARDGLRDALEG